MATVNAGSRPGSSKSNKVVPVVTDQPNGVSNGGFDPDGKAEKQSISSQKL